MKLNGWQRLWVIATALWLVVVAILTIDDLKGREHYEDIRTNATVDLVGHYLESQDRDYTYDRFEVMFKVYRGMTNQQIIDRLHKKYAGTLDFGKIESRYKSDVDAMPLTWLKTIGIGFLIWFLPAIVLYGAGLATSWVIRGFRQP